jgi:membrane-associated phospholipid phosphatase
MLLGPAQRWSWWLATLLLGTLMAAALIVQAAHWATDVVGGGLVGVTVLAVLSALGLDRWGAPAPSHPDAISPGPRAEEA